jgi:hypothetical protein
MSEEKLKEEIPFKIEKMPFESISLINPGIIDGRLPEDLYEDIIKVCSDSEVRKKTACDRTVASIKEIAPYPFNETDQTFQKFLGDMFNNWIELNDVPLPEIGIQSRVVDCWINYQKKGEFVPINSNADAVFFIAFIKIPFDSAQETNAAAYNKTINFDMKNSSLEFVYNTLTGDLATHTIQLDKEDEGRILMFPGKIAHQMYPFFHSNDEMITICGLVQMFRVS